MDDTFRAEAEENYPDDQHDTPRLTPRAFARLSATAAGSSLLPRVSAAAQAQATGAVALSAVELG